MKGVQAFVARTLLEARSNCIGLLMEARNTHRSSAYNATLRKGQRVIFRYLQINGQGPCLLGPPCSVTKTTAADVIKKHMHGQTFSQHYLPRCVFITNGRISDIDHLIAFCIVDPLLPPTSDPQGGIKYCEQSKISPVVPSLKGEDRIAQASFRQGSGA